LQFAIFSASWKPSQNQRRRLKLKIKLQKTIISLHTPDLTKFPPRSPRVRLGGYAILPRMLEKGRATVAGKNGEYHHIWPLDQAFLEFAGIDPEALKKELGKSDTEVLEWISANSQHKRMTPEIIAWTNWQENRAPNNPDGREYLNGIHKTVAPQTHRHHVVVRCAGRERFRELRWQDVNFYRSNPKGTRKSPRAF
jgi:Domain of unknown function (DUF5069)